jgi:hypothetical protein
MIQKYEKYKLQLIDNFLEHQPFSYTPQYVQGPYICYRYTMKSPLNQDESDLKTFYLFGEYHRDHTSDCIQSNIRNRFSPFTEYIKNLSKFSPSFFDLYLETGFIRKNKEGKYFIDNYDRTTKIWETLNEYDPTKDFLDTYDKHERNIIQDINIHTSSSTSTSLIRTFLNCLQPEKRDDPICKLMRIHNIDLRQPYGLTEMTDSFYFKVLSIILDQGERDFGSVLIRTNYNKIVCERYFNTTLLPLLINKLNWTSSFYILIKLLDVDEISFDRYMEILKTERVFCKQLYKRTYMKDMIIEFAREKFQQFIRENDLELAKIRSSVHNIFLKLITSCDMVQNDESENQPENKVEEGEECKSKIIDKNYVLKQSQERNDFADKQIHYFVFEEIISLFNLHTRILGLQIDIYCLSRIFKKYIPKEGTNPEMPDESRNVIIYTGSAHIANYVEFLNMYSRKNPECNLQQTFYNINPFEKGCVKIYNEPAIIRPSEAKIVHKRPRRR